MLYRNRKPDDPNEGKWLGIGGKIKENETPEECNIREVLEETGLKLRSAHFCGIIRFRADMYEDEDMYLFTSDSFEPQEDAAREHFLSTGLVRHRDRPAGGGIKGQAHAPVFQRRDSVPPARRKQHQRRKKERQG